MGERTRAIRLHGLFIEERWNRLPANWGGQMQTRRTFLGSVGAAAALGVTGGTAFGGGSGSGGESSTQENDAERKKIAETALKNRNGLNIIVGPGASNFPETLELSKHAEENGADGLLIVPPFYYKHPREEALKKYYSMIFEQVKIPINLYHIPFASGVPISHELLHSLEKYPNLAGIKDSVDDAEVYHRFVAEFPKLNMRTGTDVNLKYALDHGMGAILAEGNNFTKQIAAVFAAKRAGKDIDEPIAKLRAATKLLRAGGVDEYGPMKYALSLQMGTHQFYQRPPNSDVTEEQKGKIKEALEEIKKMG